MVNHIRTPSTSLVGTYPTLFNNGLAIELDNSVVVASYHIVVDRIAIPTTPIVVTTLTAFRYPASTWDSNC